MFHVKVYESPRLTALVRNPVQRLVHKCFTYLDKNFGSEKNAAFQINVLYWDTIGMEDWYNALHSSSCLLSFSSSRNEGIDVLREVSESNP